MTKLLEQAVARVARLSEPQQDALAARLLDDLEAEQAWDRAFAETTDADLGRLVEFARAQAPGAMSVEEWLRGCDSDREEPAG